MTPPGPEGYEFSADKTRLDVDRVHHWLAEDSYWAAGRARETVVRSIEGSACYGVYDRDGRQVAFARAVTDGATFAWLCDVYVDRSARGAGIGTWMVTGIREALRDQGVLRIVLATADAHGVYEKAGFGPLIRPDRWMEVDDRTGPLTPPA